MSAYRYLLFVMGTILMALLGAFVLEITTPAIDMMNTYSTTEASSTGIMWYTEFMELLPLIVFMLLAFMFIYGVTLRRGGVSR